MILSAGTGDSRFTMRRMYLTSGYKKRKRIIRRIIHRILVRIKVNAIELKESNTKRKRDVLKSTSKSK